MVTSNFTGDELVLFGGIERDARSRPRRGGYDIVVTVTGPRQTLVTFRKDRACSASGSMSIRAYSRTRRAYLAVLSNRPLDAITNAETLRRLQLGLDNLPAAAARQRQHRRCRRATIRSVVAFLKHQERARALPRGVERRDVPHAGAVPRLDPAAGRGAGRHLRGRRQAVRRRRHDRAHAVAPFEVYKSGFEQIVTNAARDHGLLYGLATAMMALVTGWFASVVFRRDYIPERSFNQPGSARQRSA